MVSDTGDDSPSPVSAGFGETGRSFAVFVLTAYQDKRGDRDAYTASVLAGTIRNRMVKDVVKKIELGRRLGGLVFDTEYLDVKRDFVEPDGWILGDVFFEVTYQHDIGDP